MTDFFRTRTAGPVPYSTYTAPAGYDRPPRALSMIPRPYQDDAISFLDGHPRAIVGDAPGLGKTFIAAEAAKLPAVISCPTSLIDQWADFLAEQYPTTTVRVAVGNQTQRMLTILEAMQNLDDNSWLIVNHDMWRQEYMTYLLPLETLIVDEYHHFRNRGAKRSKGLAAYAEKCPRVFGLTATPVYKDVSDLWHLLHILNPEEYTSFNRFIDRYAVTSNYGYGTRIIRTRNRDILDRELAKCMLARSYKQVGMYLPSRIDKQVVMRLTDEQSQKYRTLRDFWRVELESGTSRLFNAGAVLHQLRAMTITNEKLAEIKELAEEAAVATDAPVVIFVWYRETAKQVAAQFGPDGEVPIITGDLAPDQRAVSARASWVTIATMESLSEGVDLSDARTIIMAEETYVPGQQYQALSRVVRHRTATVEDERNDTPVICYWIRYRNTVDEVVHHKAQLRTQHNALAVLKEALMD